MEKRYQIFVSSTYIDLKDERREVIQTLLEMECIPSGMELFPATDDDSWELIKSVICQSDYYLVVIGGKYGSTDNTGVSYPEKEYDYAVAKDIPIAAFLNKDPTKLALENSELDKETREKLSNFRAKIEDSHHCKYWGNSDDLGGKVAKSLNLFFKRKPRVGWIKANSLPQEVTENIQTYKNRIEELEMEISKMSSKPPEGIENIESGQDKVTLPINIKLDGKEEKKIVMVDSTWEDLFLSVGPSLEEPVSEQSFRSSLAQTCKRTFIRENPKVKIRSVTINSEDFQMVKYQFYALGLTQKFRDEEWGSMQWELTRYGEHRLIRGLVRKKPNQSLNPTA